jgi:hypothetical protein
MVRGVMDIRRLDFCNSRYKPAIQQGVMTLPQASRNSSPAAKLCTSAIFRFVSFDGVLLRPVVPAKWIASDLRSDQVGTNDNCVDISVSGWHTT